MGLLGAQKSLFVLRASLLSLRRSQNEELKLCAQMYRELYERKGLGYAMQVADMGPKWGIDPEEQLAKICIDGSVGERGI